MPPADGPPTPTLPRVAGWLSGRVAHWEGRWRLLAVWRRLVPLRHDPAEIAPLRLRRFRLHLDAWAWGLLDPLPGGAARRTRRLARAVDAYGDPEAQAALARLDAGRPIAMFNRLQRAAMIAAAAGDHDRFEACLRLYDPALPPGAAIAGGRRFVGRGCGLAAVPVYRRLGSGDQARFEKVYDRDSDGFRRMCFAHQQVLAQHPVVGHAPLLEICEGARLARVRHAFLPWAPAARSPAAGAGIVAALARIPAASLPGADAFTTRFRIARNRPALIARAEALGPGAAAALDRHLTEAGARVLDGPLVFSHGDLNRGNYDARGQVWDWDQAGLRPYGYDAASLLREFPLADGAALAALSAAHFERPGSAARDRLALVWFVLFFLPGTPAHWRSPRLFGDLAALLPRLLAAAGREGG